MVQGKVDTRTATLDDVRQMAHILLSALAYMAVISSCRVDQRRGKGTPLLT